ncbi:hypothetical protein H5410_000223 [Solanum commersonii]|uniref:Uncharacterized protein n=1 Tax=Solanum commersonii TaxID=4109 RepID=A0A9J6AW73_SOLCO|nr:hypothetical protein H5410_000223 [Solanum commersonii]
MAVSPLRCSYLRYTQVLASIDAKMSHYVNEASLYTNFGIIFSSTGYGTLVGVFHLKEVSGLIPEYGETLVGIATANGPVVHDSELVGALM